MRAKVTLTTIFTLMVVATLTWQINAANAQRIAKLYARKEEIEESEVVTLV